jgi:hypothetical protein
MNSENKTLNDFFKVSSKSDSIDKLESIPEEPPEVQEEIPELEEAIPELEKEETPELEKEEEEPVDKQKLEIDKMLDDREIEELAEDFTKIEEREQQKKKQLDLLLQLIKILKYDVENISELTNLTIQRDMLLRKDITKQYLDLIPEFKSVYNSAYLNCLHDNSILKQKFPAINLLRQVLKCNHMNLTPKIISNGYEKVTGKKKVNRVFMIEKQMF